MTLSPNQLSSANERRNRLIKICETLPELTVESANEHLKISIRKKTLAYYQFDHHGDGTISLVCKSNPSDQRRMIRTDTDTFFVPDYLGAKGWLGIRLDLAEVDWEAVTESLRRAYQGLAEKARLIARLATNVRSDALSADLIGSINLRFSLGSLGEILGISLRLFPKFRPNRRGSTESSQRNAEYTEIQATVSFFIDYLIGQRYCSRPEIIVSIPRRRVSRLTKRVSSVLIDFNSIN